MQISLQTQQRPIESDSPGGKSESKCFRQRSRRSLLRNWDLLHCEPTAENICHSHGN